VLRHQQQLAPPQPHCWTVITTGPLTWCHVLCPAELLPAQHC
jgi:hypothetical protein